MQTLNPKTQKLSLNSETLRKMGADGTVRAKMPTLFPTCRLMPTQFPTCRIHGN